MFVFFVNRSLVINSIQTKQVALLYIVNSELTYQEQYRNHADKLLSG